MTSTFIRHELKAFWRARNVGKSIAVRVVMAILILYLLCCCLAVGVFLDKALSHAFPTTDVIISFTGILLLYYLFELLSRMQLQELPTLRVQPYLQLAIKRNSLVQYLAFTAMLSFFNLWPIILFLPFIIKVVAIKKGTLVAIAFIVSLLGFSAFNNYLALYLKRKANLNGWVLIISSLVLIAIAAGDFKFHFYSIRDISYLFFGHLIVQPIWVLLPVILGVIMYYVNFLYLKDNLYLEELTKHKTLKRTTTEFPLLDRFGAIGELVANEIKLILRNKRPRGALVATLMFLFYGLIFYNNPKLHNFDAIKIFCGMFMTGIFIITYGQYMYSWQSSHFDGLMVLKLKFADFLKAKYMLFTGVSTVVFILSTPYAYFGWHVLLIHFVMYLWNLGVNSTIILYFANRNAKRIDLSKSASFNFEGVGATQLLLSFPLLAAPFIIYWPMAALGYPGAALLVLALVAVVCIFTRNFWIKKLEADFYSRKYKITSGFREK
jgi:hypothetical protein